jgi:hypothetical protein
MAKRAPAPDLIEELVGVLHDLNRVVIEISLREVRISQVASPSESDIRQRCARGM